MGEFFLKDETYVNNNKVFCILEYDHAKLDRFLPRGPGLSDKK